MAKEIRFTLDPAIARHLSWRMAFDPRIWGSLIVVFVLFIGYEFTKAPDHQSVLSMVPFLCLPLIILVISLSVNYRMLVRTGRDAGVLRLVFEEDGILTANEKLTAKLPWEQVMRLKWTPLLLLVYQSRTVFFPIPRHMLGAETEKFISDRVQAAGGKIR